MNIFRARQAVIAVDAVTGQVLVQVGDHRPEVALLVRGRVVC